MARQRDWTMVSSDGQSWQGGQLSRVDMLLHVRLLSSEILPIRIHRQKFTRRRHTCLPRHHRPFHQKQPRLHHLAHPMLLSGRTWAWHKRQGAESRSWREREQAQRRHIWLLHLRACQRQRPQGHRPFHLGIAGDGERRTWQGY